MRSTVLRGALLITVAWFPLRRATAGGDPVPTELHSRLDAALEERIGPEARLELLAELERKVPVAERGASSAWVKGEIIRAVLDFRLNRLAESQKRLERLCSREARPSIPGDLNYRCRCALGAVLLFNREIDRSLQIYEALVRQNTEALPPMLVRRAKINHAAVLYESGRSAEALSIYELVLLDALARTNYRAALHAGHNLVHILIDQGDYEGARYTLDRLEEARRVFPVALGSRLLELRRLQLKHLEGHPNAAIAGFRSFLAKTANSAPALLEGSARRLLAEALLTAGQLDLALAEATAARSLLIRRANKATEARLTVASVLIARGAYSAALDELRAIDVSQERVLARRSTALRLRMEAVLGGDGRRDLLAELASVVASQQAHDAEAKVARGRFLEARVRASELEVELQRVAAEAAAEQARLVHRVQLGLAAFAATVGLLFLYRRRQAAAERLAAQARRSQELEKEVEARTRELVNTLNHQAEMERALDQKRRLEAVGMLAGNVAHDFNNLLQVIASSNDCLVASGHVDEGDQQALRLSNQSIEHGTQIVRQLLAYARKQPLSAKDIRVDRFVEQSKSLLDSALGARTQLVLRGEVPAASVHVDPSLLTTALLNLLSNAADAMPEGGEVRLTVVEEALTGGPPWDGVPQGRYLRFEVEDSGSGMTEEEVQRALEPFFSTKDEAHGTGLGLSSVYGFIRQSGGDLRIESCRGNGTQVEFVLPLAKCPAAVEAMAPVLSPARDRPEARGPGQAVLLVEDDGAVAIAIRTLLKRLGMTVDLARGADEACRYLERSADYRFVLSDCRMPGEMDGVGLAEWCSQHFPELDVFLMSGFYGHDQTHDRPLLPKPFTVDELRAFLREHSPRMVDLEAESFASWAQVELRQPRV